MSNHSKKIAEATASPNAISCARPTPDIAKATAEQMLSSGVYSGIVGAFTSSLSVQVSTVAEQHEIPFVTTSGDPGIYKRGHKFTFGIILNSTGLGTMGTDYAFELKKQCPSCIDLSRIAFVYSTDNPAHPFTVKAAISLINSKYSDTGAKVVDEITYLLARFLDPTPVVNRLISSDATVVFALGSETILAQLLNTANGLGYKGQFYTLDGSMVGNPTILIQNIERTNLVGTLGFFPWSEVIPAGAMEQFTKTFYKMFPQYHVIPYTSLTAAATVHTLAAAMDKAGSTDPDAVRIALQNLNLTSGPFELIPVKFNQFGNNVLHVGVLGQFQQNNNLIVVVPSQFSTGRALTLDEIIDVKSR